MNKTKSIAYNIYNILDKYRKNPENIKYDGSIIIQKIEKIVSQGLSLKIVLPAFHGKSNNRDFVISHLPDYGDYLCVNTLSELYKELTVLYPNIEILLLHEGHFHADVCLFGDDRDVSVYIKQFRKLISPYTFIKSYCINELINTGISYDDKRKYFLEKYCPTIQEIETLIQNTNRIKSLYLAYKKLYYEKTVDDGKNTLSCKDLRAYSKNRSILQLRKYVGFGKLLNETFANDIFIKLSWVYKDNSVNDQISINVLGGNTKLGTPGFFSIMKHANGAIDFISRKQALEKGLSLNMFNRLPYYATNN